MTTATADQLANIARSVLACPADAQLVVDGVPDLDIDQGELTLSDHGGIPIFGCPIGSPLAEAAEAGRNALVTLASGLGAPGTAERDTVLSLKGALVLADAVEATCGCAADRAHVRLHVTHARLSHLAAVAGEGDAVPVDLFASPRFLLNRGYLQRSLEHVNGCHQDDLRQAVALITDSPMVRIGAAGLTDLSAAGVLLHWVTDDGADCREIRFPRPARDGEDLGDLLRGELHAGFC